MLGRIIESVIQVVFDIMFRIRHGGRDQWSVSIADDVISLRKNSRLNEVVRLSKIKCIRAVAKDMGTRDEIFLVLETPEKWYWIGESFAGFDDFSNRLQSVLQFPSFDLYTEFNLAETFTNPLILLWKR